MANKIIISIMEDHQSIIDGYLYRLSSDNRFQIGGIARVGEELMPMLAANRSDALILDIEVPTSETNPNTFSILHSLPILKRKYPDLVILVISMHRQQVLVERLMELGVNGYIYKADNESIERLGEVLMLLKGGGTFFSKGALAHLHESPKTGGNPLLSPRQLEALSLCVSYPDSSTGDLAKMLGVSSSTFRNLLSSSYEKLEVRTRNAAVAKMGYLGIGTTSIEFEQ